METIFYEIFSGNSDNKNREVVESFTRNLSEGYKLISAVPTNNKSVFYIIQKEEQYEF